MPENLKVLPRLTDSISFLYVEHCTIQEDAFSIAKYDKAGKTPIPIASITVLMIGPGVTITHAAIKNICDLGATIVWCGENGSRFYACGKGETANGKNLLKQASLCMDEKSHMNVVREMYKIRFPDFVQDDMSLEQLRGLEGIRMKTIYKMLSRQTGVRWTKRTYDLSDWDSMDDINKAISSANQYLYSLCYAAIVSLGYSPGLGFIHTGRAESFVYDIADLYKAETTIPSAFISVAKGLSGDDLNREIRKQCRLLFTKTKIMDRLPKDIFRLMELKSDSPLNPASNLWDYERDVIQGGKKLWLI